VLPVFAEPYLVESLADNAILVALASIFNLVAYRAMETFSHGRRIARCRAREKSEHGPLDTFVTLALRSAADSPAMVGATRLINFTPPADGPSASFARMKLLIIAVLFIPLCVLAGDKKAAEGRSQAAITSCRGLLESWDQFRQKDLEARTQQVSKDRFWVGLYQPGDNADEYICSVQCKSDKSCVTKWAQGPNGVIYKPR
jgi:hypothetical protein